MIIVIRILCFLSFLLAVLNVKGQVEITKFNHLTTEQGLSNNVINCILQDKEGFMWFGTDEGLNKFDGVNIKVYKHNQKDNLSISNNRILSIIEDHTGTLWVGTQSGLNKLNKSAETFTRYLPNPRKTNSISHDQIKSIYEDKKGILWIGTYNGLNEFNPKTSSFKFYQHERDSDNHWRDNIINSIVEDNSGHIWVGTTLSLSRLDKERGEFQRYFYNENNYAKQSPFSWVTKIGVDRAGTIWLSTHSDGLKEFNTTTSEFRSYNLDPSSKNNIKSNYIISFFIDPDDIIWIATQDAGLTRYDKKTETFTHFKNDPLRSYTLSKNTVLSIFLDRAKVLWIGTFAAGIDYLDQKRKKIIQYSFESNPSKDLNLNVISAIYPDKKNNIWIGTSWSLNKFNRKAGTIAQYKIKSKNFKSMNDSSPDCIYEDTKGKLWLGLGGGGLKRFDPKKETFDNYLTTGKNSKMSFGRIKTILEDSSKKILWVGSSLGLIKLSPESGDYKIFKPNDVNSTTFFITKIIAGKDECLWVSTYSHGLYKFDPATNTFINYKKKDSKYFDNSIENMTKTKSGELLLVFVNHGIIKFRPNKNTFHQIKSDLTDIPSKEVFEDKHGDLWILTQSQGVLKYTLNRGTIKKYDITDGLWANGFYSGYYSCLSNELYLGGLNAVNVFNTDSLKSNPFVPKVVVSSFKVFDKPRQIIDNKITLHYYENFFSFEFAALSYANPDKNQYKYKMEGLDEDWIDAGTRKYASYTNLDPGEYTLRVIGSNHDNVWNKKGLSIKIIITPPLWRTYVAYVIYALVFSGLFIIIRKNIRKQEKLKRDLERKKLESEKLRELDQLKTHFFDNISHEIRTPLTLIVNPLEKIISGKLDLDEVKEFLPLVYRNARRLKELVNQVLDLSKLEAKRMKLKTSEGDLIAFIKSIVESYNSLAKEKEIELRFVSNISECFILFDKDKFEKIVTNLLGNAFKFTRSKGAINVLIRIDRSEGETGIVRIEVSDTGIGIPEKHLGNIFNRFYQIDHSYTREFEGTGIGLALTKELVQLYNGKINVSSTEGKGTSFVIEIPVTIVLPLEYPSNNMIIPQPGFTFQSTGEENYIVVSNPAIDQDAPLLLIIEDNPDLLKYLEHIFRKDYKLLKAVNGLDGLKAAKENVPDLVLTDLMMPGIDGIELCRRIKDDSKISHIPVLMLTARASIESRIEGLRTGADDYISKPFHAEELTIRVKNLIEQSKRISENFKKTFTKKSSNEVVAATEDKLLKKVIEIIELNLSDPEFGREALEKEVAMSRTNLYRKMKSLTNFAPSDFIREYRIKRAAELISIGEGNISEIAFKVGFTNMSYFSKCFKDTYGKSPKHFIEEPKEADGSK